MQSNMDTALHTLAQEINVLHEQAGNIEFQKNSVVVAMGHKLIALRELLREKYGTASGRVDATGKHAPKNWTKWVENNLPITKDHAAFCIHAAVNPDAVRKTHNDRAKKLASTTPKPSIGALRRVWPVLTTEQRSWARQQVIALSKEAY